MIANFIETVYCRNNASDKNPNLNYDDFTPIQKVIYLIQQFLYIDYVCLMSGALRLNRNESNSGTFILNNNNVSGTLLNYRNSLVLKTNVLKNSIFDDPSIYNVARPILNSISKGVYPSLEDLHNVLIYPNIQDHLYSKLESSFYIPLLNTFNKNNHSLKEDKIHFPTIYTYDIVIHQQDNYNQRNIQNTITTNIHLVLKEHTEFEFQSFNLIKYTDKQDPINIFAKNYESPLWIYLSRFDWSNKTFDHLIALMTSLHFENNKFNMYFGTNYCSIIDTCYDMLTKSRFVSGRKANDTLTFIDFLKYLRTNYNFNVTDTKLLGDLLNMCNLSLDTRPHDDSLMNRTHDEILINNKVIEYLTKDVKEITQENLVAFKNSVLSTFINDRLVKSTEAAEDDLGDLDNINTESPTDETSTASETDTSIDDTSGDIVGENDNEVDDDVTSDELGDSSKLPPADPVQLIIELADDNPKIEDVVFRQEIIQRVNALSIDKSKVSNNEELLMLQNWVSRWLNLVTIQTTKNFLAQLNLKVIDF